MKLVVEHDDKRAADLFWREQNSAIMNMSVGTSIGFGGMPMPITQHFSFLIDKTELEATVTVAGEARPSPVPTQGGYRADKTVRPPVPAAPEAALTATVPLVALAWTRSGEKGDLFNVAVIARQPDYLAYIRQALTPAAISALDAGSSGAGAAAGLLGALQLTVTAGCSGLISLFPAFSLAPLLTVVLGCAVISGALGWMTMARPTAAVA